MIFCGEKHVSCPDVESTNCLCYRPERHKGNCQCVCGHQWEKGEGE